jgi:MoxR-like ATPase
MSESLILVSSLSPSSLHYYELEEKEGVTQIEKRHTIGILEDKPGKPKLTCSCPLHRFKGTCTHVEKVNNGLGFSLNERSKEFVFAWPLLAKAVEGDLRKMIFAPSYDAITFRGTGYLSPIHGGICFPQTTMSLNRLMYHTQSLDAVSTDKIFSTEISLGDEKVVLPESVADNDRWEIVLNKAFLERKPINDTPTSSTVKSLILKGRTKPEKKEKPEWLRPRPPEGFYVSEENWTSLLYAIHATKHVILTGPTGCGKTELCLHVSQAAGTPLEAFNFGAMTEARSSLIGNTHLDTATGTLFKKSRFVEALEKESGIVLCDEISRAPIDAFNLILPCMDRQGYLSLDESKEEEQLIFKGEKVVFFATANIGIEYTGTNAMDRALWDRFAVVIDVGYPPKEKEIEVLQFRAPDTSHAFILKLVTVANQQREMYETDDFSRQISTRMLIDCAEAVEKGLPQKVAITTAILNKFDNMGGAESDRARAMPIFQRLSLLSS